MTTDIETAFVLHTRPYRETSQLVTLFSRHHGRLNVLARGSRRGKQGRATLSPFIELQVAWQGRGSLKTLTLAEAVGNPGVLQGNTLFVGFYLNELLMRLLHEHDPHEALYDHYSELLHTLRTASDPEPSLRRFELGLLDELGYGLQLHVDVATGEAVVPEGIYRYLFGEGMTLAVVAGEKNFRSGGLFSGVHLLAIQQGDYSDPAVCAAAKKLMRLALQPHLGAKPLQSRMLFHAAGNNP